MPPSHNCDSSEPDIVIRDICNCCCSVLIRSMPRAPFQRESSSAWNEIWICMVGRLHLLAKYMKTLQCKTSTHIMRTPCIKSIDLEYFPPCFISRRTLYLQRLIEELHPHNDHLTSIIRISQKSYPRSNLLCPRKRSYPLIHSLIAKFTLPVRNR